MCVLTDYRGYTIRKKRWSPEIEEKIKNAFSEMKNESEAIQYLLELGLTAHEIDLVLQYFLTEAARKNQLIENNAKNGNLSNANAAYLQTPISSHEQQLELIGFSQSVRAFAFVHFFTLSLSLPHFFVQ